MKLFAKNIENELLYIKNFTPPAFEQSFKSIDDLLEQDSTIQLHRYTEDTWLLDGTIIKEKNSIPSAYSVIRLTSKNRNYLQDVFNESPFKLSKNKVFKNDDKNNAVDYFQEIVNFGAVTLSPNDPSAIQAVHQINDVDEFSRSWDLLAARHRLLCVENSLSGDPFKLYILRGQLVAAYGMVPAFVVGDGNSDIKALVERQNKARAKNVFYEKRKITNISNAIDQSRVPEKNEIVRLKRSSDVGKGAVFIDLTKLLAERYALFVQEVDKIFIDGVYIEITCYSEDFLAGPNHHSFVIRNVRFNTADLREVFSDATTADQIKNLLQKFKTSVPTEVKESVLGKSAVFENTYLRSATQVAILKEAAYRLGLRIEVLDKELIKFTNCATGRSVRFIAGMSSKTVSLARDASNNKYLTKQLLDRAGINTPKGFRMDISQKDEAWKTAKSFQGSVVVKPLDGSGGVGVTTDITTKGDFENAWQICEDLGTKVVLVEENVTGNDYRIIVIGEKVCAVTQRVAAYVEGDGVHTIKELISIKATQRISNPFYRIKHFEENDVMVHFLKKQNKSLTYVPAEGEHVQLLNAVNIGSGGESIDRTDEIHPEWINVAVKARKAILNSFHVGLDVMADSIGRSPHDQKWSIIEVNTNPELGLQLFPGTGHPRDVGATLFQEILGESEPRIVCYKVKIFGKVQGVGFRKWFQQLCNLRSLVGYVKNLDNSTVVEAKLIGPDVTVDGVVRESYTGPKNAVVRSIMLEHEKVFEISQYNQLEIL